MRIMRTKKVLLALFLTMAMCMTGCGGQKTVAEDGVEKETLPEVTQENKQETQEEAAGAAEETASEDISDTEAGQSEFEQHMAEKEAEFQQLVEAYPPEELTELLQKNHFVHGPTPMYDSSKMFPDLVGMVTEDNAMYNCYTVNGENMASVYNVKDFTLIKSEVEYEGVTYPVTIYSGCYSMPDFTPEYDVVQIPDFIKVIGPNSFRSCSAREIILPETVEFVSGCSTFIFCSNLEKVTFPTEYQTEQWWEETFAQCINLKEVSITSEDAIIFRATFSGCSNLTSVTLPETTHSIYGTFEDCTSLQHFEIPESTYSIFTAFENSGVTEITLPEGLFTIGKISFYQTAIAECKIPPHVKSIAFSAFDDTNLTELVIPDTVYHCDVWHTIKNCPELTNWKSPMA